MAENTKIEWADHTFNPWIGCQHVSAACDFCYAETLMDHRLGQVVWGPHGERVRTKDANWRKPLGWNRRAEAAGVRERVFCASLADVFDNRAPDQWRTDLWNLIDETPHLIWMLLTKRPENIKAMKPETGWQRNVWLGVTAEAQLQYNRRWNALKREDVAVRFISYEPALGSLTVLGDGHRTRQIPDWLICGGESGVNARPMHPGWLRSIRDECQNLGIPFFFKQWGEWASVSEVEGPGEHYQFPDYATVRRTGKARAGRTLGGRTWDQVPV